MKRFSGIKLLEEREGEGRPAQKGDRVVYNIRMFLNKGDEVPINAKQAEYLPKEMIRIDEGATFIDHTTILGSRQSMAGVEHALMGMKVGGYRKVRISPHLAYREKGIPDLIPPHSLLICEIWLRQIVRLSS
ncbi:FKBP-type peptidyl-prolyl cis-trans isomerase [Petrachloros mirabilis]|nr:FKBP-type peptidyl-prolyl cis-trans isomerase [Nitrospira sp.]